MLTLSLIIPVYNEERHIRRCLDAVSRQTIMPDEVIVVDNNGTDRTVAIAKEYDFVTIIHAPHQGHGHARSAGFDAAQSDILGRIDADSRMAEDWVEQVAQSFESFPELGGVTGLGRTAILPGVNWVRSTIFSRSYFWFAHAQFDTVTMWGANMAIRRQNWDSVRDQVCLDDSKVHEDQDISLCMAAEGIKIGVNNALLVTTNGQGFRYLPKLIHYTALFRSTYALHEKIGTFDRPNFPRLGFVRTLPGRLCSIPISLSLLLVSTLLFPVDYIVNTIWPKSWWLD